MRRYKRSDGRTKGCIRLNEQGSIVVEASLIMPFILILLIIFIVLIRLCAMQMALYSTASQAVRQAATTIYPVELAWQSIEQKSTPNSGDESRKGFSDWSELAAEAAEWLPEPAGTLVSSVLRNDWRPLQNMAATELGRGFIEPIVREFADESVLEPNRISLTLLTLPDLKNKVEAYLAVALEYEFPLRLPFYDKPMILRAQAAERVWISDISPATYGSDNEAINNQLLHIVAIEPTPLRPGRKATVIAKTAPGGRISLEVQYKSGSSKAKHLGEAKADENGYVQWTWHVSGNTTPGIWKLTATADDGEELSVSRHFVVEKMGSK